MDSSLNPRAVVFALAVVMAALGHAQGQVTFSSLAKTLVVTATLPGGGNLTEVHSGSGTILVGWKLDPAAPAGADAAYRKVRTKLCFAPQSQVLRQWRKADDNLSKDKTCLYNIALAPYAAAGAAANYTVPKTIPGATYFVRAYALDAAGKQVAYGQTNKTAHAFAVIPITGRHASIDIAVAVLSTFSVVALFTYFVAEKYYLKRKKQV